MLEDTNSEVEIYDTIANKQDVGNPLPIGNTSWYTLNGQDFFLSPTSIPNIPSGLYNIISTQESGIGLSKVEYSTDDIFLLSGIPYTTIINDLATFWNSIDKFNMLKLKPYRGILLYGEAGCGKSSLIYKLIEEIKTFNGVVIQFHEPTSWLNILPVLRALESNRPIICVIKNLDKILSRFGEDNFQYFLESIHSVSNIVYIATTNNINAIPYRIRNSPSQFDAIYEITKPNATARREYLKKKLANAKQKKYKLDQLVEDTDGFTMAHLREFFVSIFVFNKDYERTVVTLKNAKDITEKSKFFGRKQY